MLSSCSDNSKKRIVDTSYVLKNGSMDCTEF